MYLCQDNETTRTMNTIEYKDFVHDLILRGDGRTFLNSDEEHALIVLTELINMAKEELRIFAGSLTGKVGSDPEYIIALSEFIERGGKLLILLNDYQPDSSEAKSSRLYRRLSYYQSLNKPVIIKSTNTRPYRTNDPNNTPVHFTVADHKGYRLETDTNERSAQCSVDDPLLASAIADFFDGIFTAPASKEINFVEYFNDVDK